MSRRNNRKKENNFKIWLPLICIIVVGVTFYMLYDIKSKIKEMDTNTVSNTTSVENTIKEENLTSNNTINENVVTNNVIEEEISNSVKNTTENTATKNTQNKTNSSESKTNGAGVTDKKQLAIKLVSEEWGKDDTVDFVFDYVNEDGEYVIAVKSKNSATVKCYYRVNLDDETVELD